MINCDLLLDVVTFEENSQLFDGLVQFKKTVALPFFPRAGDHITTAGPWDYIEVHDSCYLADCFIAKVYLTDTTRRESSWIENVEEMVKSDWDLIDSDGNAPPIEDLREISNRIKIAQDSEEVDYARKIKEDLAEAIADRLLQFNGGGGTATILTPSIPEGFKNDAITGGSYNRTDLIDAILGVLLEKL